MTVAVFGLGLFVHSPQRMMWVPAVITVIFITIGNKERIHADKEKTQAKSEIHIIRKKDTENVK